jgi:hypothetical protein
MNVLGKDNPAPSSVRRLLRPLLYTGQHPSRVPLPRHLDITRFNPFCFDRIDLPGLPPSH